MPTTIYALCEPDLQVPVIRYIGKTANMAQRVKAHLSQTVKESTRVGNWVKSLVTRGETPVLVTLTQVPDEIGSAAEILYIRLAREGGMDLCNLTDGGDGVVNPSPESREKLRRSKLGRRNPNFGGVPAATLAAAGAANSLRVWTPETRESFREAKLGAKNPNFGKTRSEATRAKQSETCRAVFALRRMPDFTDGAGI